MARLTESLLEGVMRAIGASAAPVAREIGSWIMTGFWGLISGFISASFAKALGKIITFGSSTDLGKEGPVLKEELAEQIFESIIIVLVLALMFSVAWLLFVRIWRPSSPTAAVPYRRYWLGVAMLLLVCIVLYHANTPFARIRDLDPASSMLLLLLLTLSGLLFLFLMSILRSPPTVIAAVPFGAHIARVRWR